MSEEQQTPVEQSEKMITVITPMQRLRSKLVNGIELIKKTYPNDLSTPNVRDVIGLSESVIADIDEVYFSLERKEIEDAHVEGQKHIIDVVAKSVGKEIFKNAYNEIVKHVSGDRDENAVKFYNEKYSSENKETQPPVKEKFSYDKFTKEFGLRWVTKETGEFTVNDEVFYFKRVSMLPYKFEIRKYNDSKFYFSCENLQVAIEVILIKKKINETL